MAKLAARKYARIVQKLGFPVSIFYVTFIYEFKKIMENTHGYCFMSKQIWAALSTLEA
jgi:hypothetical protein